MAVFLEYNSQAEISRKQNPYNRRNIALLINFVTVQTLNIPITGHMMTSIK